MSTNTKLKRVNRSSNPIILNNRLSVYYKIQRGLALFPNDPLPLDPKALTYTQQNSLIEYLKFYQSMLMIEIADYLKTTSLKRPMWSRPAEETSTSYGITATLYLGQLTIQRLGLYSHRV